MHEACLKEQKALPKLGWKCTKKYYVSAASGFVFSALTHWKGKGCSRGGTFIRVYDRKPFKM